MNLVQSKILTTIQKSQVRELWNNEFPENYHLKDVGALDDYLTALQDHNHIIIVNKQNTIVAWYLDFIRDKERWFTIIVNSDQQGLGLGSRIMMAATERNQELNGWAVSHSNFRRSNGLPYISALGFYKKFGFNIHHEIQHEKQELDLIKITFDRS